MASTATQILNGIKARIEAIEIPDADKFDATDVFQGVIGTVGPQAQDRSFALQPGIPQRSTRYVCTPQGHEVNVVLVVAYRLTTDAWGRATDDGSLITEALWSCISGASAVADLEHIEIGPGQIRPQGNDLLVAERQLTIEWRRAD
jgi:hypothetical protein